MERLQILCLLSLQGLNFAFQLLHLSFQVYALWIEVESTEGFLKLASIVTMGRILGAFWCKLDGYLFLRFQGVGAFVTVADLRRIVAVVMHPFARPFILRPECHFLRNSMLIRR